MLFKKSKESWHALRDLLDEAAENQTDIVVTNRGMLAIKDENGRQYNGSNISIGGEKHLITDKMLHWLEEKEIILKEAV